MSVATKKAVELMEVLPEDEQNFVLEFIKKLVIAWDPDYTRLTAAEKAELDDAELEIQQGNVVSHSAINW